MMKDFKKTINHQEFLKVTKNPPCKLNMELDKLLQDRYNNNSYTLYRRNELVLHSKSEDRNGKIKNILDKKWKEETEKVKEFFRILAVEGNRRFKRSRLLPSPQPSPQPQSLPQPQSQPQSSKKKLPLLLPRPPFPQPRVYYQPRSYEYYSYRSQQLPSHYEQCIPAEPLYQPQLQPQPQPQSSTSLPPQPSLPQPYAICQPISFEDNQPQPLLSPSQLQTDESCWQMYQFPDEFYYYPQPPPLQQLEPLPDDEQYEQPQSPLPYEVYFNDFDYTSSSHDVKQ